MVAEQVSQIHELCILWTTKHLYGTLASPRTHALKSPYGFPPVITGGGGTQSLSWCTLLGQLTALRLA